MGDHDVMTESKLGAGQIRRFYERSKAPFTSTARARRSVLELLNERKTLQRAGEALMIAAIPYSGDPTVKKAIEDYRAALEGRTSA
jgi:hypothetical protein